MLVQQIKVHTDQTGDPLTLKVSANVEKIATVTPEVVHFVGDPGKTLETTVHILPSDRYAFSLKDQVIPAMKNVEAVLRLSNTREKAWDLVVTNTRKITGRYYEVITLVTDSAAQPELKIRVFGNLNVGDGSPAQTTGP
ncbi:MAG: hypothetical protein RBR67_06960 [Desulfobacterium sp.]|nr:hypothetical protein [Desulfobacterium sp.]